MIRLMRRRRRRASIFLAAALVALTVGVSVAVAKSGPSQVKVQFRTVTDTVMPCPGSVLDKHIVGQGKVWVDTKGGPIHVVVQFRGITPGKWVMTITDKACLQPIDILGNFSVGHDKNGTFKGTSNITGQQSFSLVAIHLKTDEFVASNSFKLGSL
jgi:hypothetical protein